MSQTYGLSFHVNVVKCYVEAHTVKKKRVLGE